MVQFGLEEDVVLHYSAWHPLESERFTETFKPVPTASNQQSSILLPNNINQARSISPLGECSTESSAVDGFGKNNDNFWRRILFKEKKWKKFCQQENASNNVEALFASERHTDEVTQSDEISNDESFVSSTTGTTNARVEQYNKLYTRNAQASESGCPSMVCSTTESGTSRKPQTCFVKPDSHDKKKVYFSNVRLKVGSSGLEEEQLNISISSMESHNVAEMEENPNEHVETSFSTELLTHDIEEGKDEKDREKEGTEEEKEEPEKLEDSTDVVATVETMDTAVTLDEVKTKEQELLKSKGTEDNEEQEKEKAVELASASELEIESALSLVNGKACQTAEDGGTSRLSRTLDEESTSKSTVAIGKKEKTSESDSKVDPSDDNIPATSEIVLYCFSKPNVDMDEATEINSVMEKPHLDESTDDAGNIKKRSEGSDKFGLCQESSSGQFVSENIFKKKQQPKSTELSEGQAFVDENGFAGKKPEESMALPTSSTLNKPNEKPKAIVSAKERSFLQTRNGEKKFNEIKHSTSSTFATAKSMRQSKEQADNSQRDRMLLEMYPASKKQTGSSGRLYNFHLPLSYFKNVVDSVCESNQRDSRHSREHNDSTRMDLQNIESYVNASTATTTIMNNIHSNNNNNGSKSKTFKDYVDKQSKRNMEDATRKRAVT